MLKIFFLHHDHSTTYTQPIFDSLIEPALDYAERTLRLVVEATEKDAIYPLCQLLFTFFSAKHTLHKGDIGTHCAMCKGVAQKYIDANVNISHMLIYPLSEDITDDIVFLHSIEILHLLNREHHNKVYLDLPETESFVFLIFERLKCISKRLSDISKPPAILAKFNEISKKCIDTLKIKPSESDLPIYSSSKIPKTNNEQVASNFATSKPMPNSKDHQTSSKIKSAHPKKELVPNLTKKENYPQFKTHVNVAAIGSVDCGKSTIMGHLHTLLHKSTRKKVSSQSVTLSKYVDYSKLLDVDDQEVAR